MSREYWRRIHVPECCPDCGVGVYQPKQVTGTQALFSELLKSAYSGWVIQRLKRHQFWRMPYWSAHCADCLIRESLNRPSIFERLPKIEFGSFTIPFPSRRDHEP